MFTIEHVSKVYPEGRGLFDFSLSCPAGSITAVIGPNGAGKSTLFDSINGLKEPDSGSFLLDGVPLSDVKVSHMGFLPEADFLIGHLSARQMVNYILQMKDIPISDDEIQYFVNGFSLQERMEQKIASLSQGLKKRVAILCAVIGNPELIVLDEPLNALDIESVFFLKELLLRKKEQGCHILISSHVLSFLDGLVTQSVFLKNGRVEYIAGNQNMASLEQIYKEIFHLESQESHDVDD